MKLQPLKMKLEEFANKKLNDRWISILRDVAPNLVEDFYDAVNFSLPVDVKTLMVI